MRKTLAVIACLASSLVLAQTVPGSISFNARLTDTGGAPITGPHAVSFGLYDTSSGGAALWTESLSGASFSQEGLTYLELGATTPLTASALDGRKLYLEISVDGTTMSPRLSIVSVPYAIRASVAASALTIGTLTQSQIQQRVTGVCSAGQAIRSIDAAGGVQCETLAVGGGDITSVTTAAGSGLTGGAATGDAALALATCANGEVLKSNGTVWACAAPASVAPSGGLAVTSGSVGLQSCASGEVLRSTGAGWACAALQGAATSNLIANFEFDETTGTAFRDSSGLNNNATFVSGIALGSIGRTGNSASFSGGMAQIPSGNTVTDGTQMEIEAWVRPTQDASNGTRVIATKPGVWTLSLVGGTTYELQFSVTSNDNQTCTVTSTNATLPTNTFTFIQGWYDGKVIAVGAGGPAWPIGGQVLATARCEVGLLKQVAGGVINIGSSATNVNQYLGFLDTMRVNNLAVGLASNANGTPNPFPGSTIVTSLLDAQKVLTWAGRQGDNWRACYRKTRDGATAAAFHANCNLRGPSMTFIRLANGRVLGGYNPTSWSSNGEYNYYGSGAFIFSLTNSKRYFAVMTNSNPYISYNGPAYGPTFGNGHDIYVNAAMDLGYVNFPYAYGCNGVSQSNPNNVCAQELAGINNSIAIATSELEVWVQADQ